MAKYLYSLDNSQPMTVKITTNADVKDGDIVAITAGLVGPLAEADSDIIGIAIGDTDSGDDAAVLLLNPRSVIRVSYYSSTDTKTSLAAADRFGTLFDWDATEGKMDLDDTTGGVFAVVNYDNDNDTADVCINAAKLWTA